MKTKIKLNETKTKIPIKEIRTEIWIPVNSFTSVVEKFVNFKKQLERFVDNPSPITSATNCLKIIAKSRGQSKMVSLTTTTAL